MAAELLKRQFLAEIVPLLFPKNNIMDFAINDDAFINGNSVEIQNAGALASVLVDNSSYPLSVAQRSDTAHQYVLEQLNTPVSHIPTVEELTEAGGAIKRASIAQQQALAIRTKATSRILVNWLTGIAADHKVATTGSARAATAPSATGTRLAFTKADLIDAIQILNQDDIPVDEGNKPILAIPPVFYSDILGISEFVDANKLGGGQRLVNGQVGEILGCRVVLRSSIGVTDASDVIKAEGAAGAATDQQAAILYHPSFVRRAMGAFKVYLNADRAEYAGTVISTELRVGGTQARNDKKGVVMLFEDT